MMIKMPLMMARSMIGLEILGQAQRFLMWAYYDIGKELIRGIGLLVEDLSIYLVIGTCKLVVLSRPSPLDQVEASRSLFLSRLVTRRYALSHLPEPPLYSRRSGIR